MSIKRVILVRRRRPVAAANNRTDAHAVDDYASCCNLLNYRRIDSRDDGGAFYTCTVYGAKVSSYRRIIVALCGGHGRY